MICRATLEYDEETPIPTREYILQNWRADVVALTTSTGDLLERITYDARPLSEGGIPFATHPTDLRSSARGGATSATPGYGTPSGVVNNDDYLYFLTLYGLGDWRADWNRDGTVDVDDHSAFYTQWSAATGSWGRGVLSNRGNILGYAGYVHEPATGAAGGGHATMWHVRHRVLHSGLGRWIQRDPLDYPEGPNLYWYGASNPIGMLDAMGLACSEAVGCGTGSKQPEPGGGEPPPALPGLPACLSTSQMSEIQQAIDAIKAQCPGIQISLRLDSTCASGSGGARPTGSCAMTVTICTGPANPNRPNPASDCNKQFDTILHELRHVAQACSAYGLCSKPWRSFLPGWNNEDNTICREVDAYCQENPRFCPGGVPSQNSLLSICNRSCDSLYNPGRLWDTCYARCQAIASMCAGGVYTPPPPPPPWWLPIVPRIIEILPYIPPTGPMIPHPIGGIGGVGVT